MHAHCYIIGLPALLVWTICVFPFGRGCSLVTSSPLLEIYLWLTCLSFDRPVGTFSGEVGRYIWVGGLFSVVLLSALSTLTPISFWTVRQVYQWKWFCCNCLLLNMKPLLMVKTVELWTPTPEQQSTITNVVIYFLWNSWLLCTHTRYCHIVLLRRVYRFIAASTYFNTTDSMCTLSWEGDGTTTISVTALMVASSSVQLCELTFLTVLFDITVITVCMVIAFQYTCLLGVKRLVVSYEMRGELYLPKHLI